MSRAVLVVLDSCGIGFAPDADAYGDGGANTIGHIYQACAMGLGNRAGIRQGALKLPHLESLGLLEALATASGEHYPKTQSLQKAACFGSAIETSPGKDTPSGHWEIAGAPVDFNWGYFPDTTPAFPAELTKALIVKGQLPGILGNCHASGTEIIGRLGCEHLENGKPIVYTSADSVLQIAAHEQVFGLERLYDLCRIARQLCDRLNIGRVIARPFLGENPQNFKRTANRRDFAIPPPFGGLLDQAKKAERMIFSIGKLGDIFAHRATGIEKKGKTNADNIQLTLECLDELADGGLIFANYVDFDSEFGHRRDSVGYAQALEYFDQCLPAFFERLRKEDLLILTADHGNDPTWAGSDHTREQIPILTYQPGGYGKALGRRTTYADIGASVCAHLGLGAPPKGISWI